MIEMREIGDGYVKFIRDGVLVGEVYALAQKDRWRSRVNDEDKDFDSREEAIDDVRSRVIV